MDYSKLTKIADAYGSYGRGASHGRDNMPPKKKAAYSAAQKAAAQELGVSPRDILVRSNSHDKGYDDTVSMSAEDLIKKPYFAFIKFGEDYEIISAYAISVKELMPLFNKWSKSNTTVCREPSDYNNTESGTLTRIPFEILEGYEISL